MKPCPICGRSCRVDDSVCPSCRYRFPPRYKGEREIAGIEKPAIYHPAVPRDIDESPDSEPIRPIIHVDYVAVRRVGDFIRHLSGVLSTYLNRIFHDEPDWEGRVVGPVEASEEPRGIDWPRTFLVFSIFLYLLPFILITMSVVLAFFIILALFGLGFLAYAFTPFLLMPLGFLRGRGAKKRDERIPVYAFRIENPAGDIAQVRSKGYFKAGGIVQGDEVSVWGKWKGGGRRGRGTLIMQRAYNNTSETRVYSRMRWRTAILISISLLLLLTIICLISSLG